MNLSGKIIEKFSVYLEISKMLKYNILLIYIYIYIYIQPTCNSFKVILFSSISAIYKTSIIIFSINCQNFDAVVNFRYKYIIYDIYNFKSVKIVSK